MLRFLFRRRSWYDYARVNIKRLLNIFRTRRFDGEKTPVIAIANTYMYCLRSTVRRDVFEQFVVVSTQLVSSGIPHPVYARERLCTHELEISEIFHNAVVFLFYFIFLFYFRAPRAEHGYCSPYEIPIVIFVRCSFRHDRYVERCQ